MKFFEKKFHSVSLPLRIFYNITDHLIILYEIYEIM